MNSPEPSPYLDTAPLQAGDTVRLVAASGPTDEESLLRAIGVLESWGLRVKLGDHIRAKHPRAEYLAGTDEERRADLVEAWCAEDTSAVITLRGGYGAMRLLDGIDFERMLKYSRRPDGRPKLLTGSSDVTALHQAWWHHLGVATLFCPMPGNTPFEKSKLVPAEVASWLFEPWAGRELGFPVAEEGLEPPARRSEARTLVPGTAEGILCGGNLSLVAASMGSAEARGSGRKSGSTSGIAVLEDVDEELYRIDNLLLQALRGGWFDRASALVLGSWQDCAPVAEVEALVLELLGDRGIPIVSELGFGHDIDAPSLPLGVVARLDAPSGERPTLTIPDQP